jgi:hypothetical protein
MQASCQEPFSFNIQAKTLSVRYYVLKRGHLQLLFVHQFKFLLFTLHLQGRRSGWGGANLFSAFKMASDGKLSSVPI